MSAGGSPASASVRLRPSYDVIIVGTGAAGLYCALNLPDRLRVCVVTKQAADESDSFLAQGGICMLRGEEDFQPYFDDTMRAGHFENDPDAVTTMIRSSNTVIRDLVRLGVDFNRTPAGELDCTREGAHSKPRILFHADVTGREITSTLLTRVLERPNVDLVEQTCMLDLICTEAGCGGIVARTSDGTVLALRAPHVVLATGGIGGLYQNSTNFPHITGDAIGIALAHGIALEHLDYVQIHPTTLYSTRPGRRFLVSESVRGEGATLLDAHGRRFTDELQPRDVVTAAIRAQMEKDGTDHVLEDLRPLGEATIKGHFPNIYERCLEEGVDPLSEPVPVVPAQHYFMGGIRADLAGRTSMPGLYAVGETACNGVHGRNRLASNSLLESLVFAQRAADDMLFSTARSATSAREVSLEAYADVDAVLAGYRDAATREIRRMAALDAQPRGTADPARPRPTSAGTHAPDSNRTTTEASHE
jgi:L-aspartate oxidase